MYITIENKKFEQLKLISQLAAQQLFFQQDYIQLAQAVQAEKDPTEYMQKIVEHFPNFMITNNTLIKLLADVKVLAQKEEIENHPPIDEPPTPKKPNLTIVK